MPITDRELEETHDSRVFKRPGPIFIAECGSCDAMAAGFTTEHAEGRLRKRHIRDAAVEGVS
jgi:hypothetical protein